MPCPSSEKQRIYLPRTLLLGTARNKSQHVVESPLQTWKKAEQWMINLDKSWVLGKNGIYCGNWSTFYFHFAGTSRWIFVQWDFDGFSSNEISTDFRPMKFRRIFVQWNFDGFSSNEISMDFRPMRFRWIFVQSGRTWSQRDPLTPTMTQSGDDHKMA
jgi:hypothetical protein